MLVVGVIGHLAEAAWHHPDLTVSFATVTVKLMSHDAKGITEKDFQLAAKIEEVVMWPPDKPEVAAPKASPEDPRGRYIHYDE
jgi:4a-hydroxytetrahydrobiopterin dehydratase